MPNSLKFGENDNIFQDELFKLFHNYSYFVHNSFAELIIFK